MRIVLAVTAALAAFPFFAHGQARGSLDVDNRRGNGCDSITAQQPMNPYAYIMREHCHQSDARYKQAVAKIYGRPEPSLKVLFVPAHGSPDAKRYGVACVGGLVLVRVKNGWEQALDANRRYYRCRDA